MKYKSLIFASIIFFLCGGVAVSSDPAPLSEAEAKQILVKIKDREKTLQTFIARVKQIKQTQLFKEPLHSEGMIYFDHTGKLLLKMAQPSPVIIFFKDDRLYIHYPDYGKTEETYIGNNFFGKYFGVGTSLDDFYEQYAVEIFTATRTGLYQLKMRPKEERMAKKIEMIEVMFQKDNLLPNQVRIQEKDGDDTTITLEFTSINQPLPKDIFNMDLGNANQYNQ